MIPSTEKGLPGLQEVLEQLQDLQRRVLALERRIAEPQSAAQPPKTAAPEPGEVIAGEPSRIGTAAAAVVIGRALLGIAGAYFLRALTELGTLPLKTGILAGVAYAFLWLILAARSPAEQRLVTTLHSLTAVLVLAPLLWEAVVRFRTVENWTVALILSLFSVFGLTVSWRKNLSVIAWISTLAGAGTALVLLFATRDLVPFTFALLIMAVAVESSACFEHWLPERWVVALAADAALLLMGYMVTREGGLPQSYTAIPLSAALIAHLGLLFIYSASTMMRTLWRGFPFTVFETAQSAVAFLIGMGGALQIARMQGAGAWLLAAFTLLTGAGCYLVSFAFLERREHSDRNFYTYSTFGLLLALSGSRMLLEETMMVVVWSALALLCVWIGGRHDRLTLRWHGTLYLLLAAVSSGITALASGLLVGSGTGVATFGASGWANTAMALVCYGIMVHYTRQKETSRAQLAVFFLVAAVGIWNAGGLLAGILTGVCVQWRGAQDSLAYCATLRTLVLTFGSVLLAWVGARWRRQELVFLVYPVMVLGAYKLLTQDLRQDRTLALFLSLVLYGGALMFLPRLLQSRPGRPAAAGG